MPPIAYTTTFLTMRPIPNQLVAALALVALAPAVHADGREPGSLLIYPIQQSDLLNPGVFNVVSVTNTNRAGSGATDVHFQYVNVSPGSGPFLFANCNISDRVETLTPADTLSVLTSCHNGAAGARGYLVVTARNPDEVDRPWSFNHLVGSEQIVSVGGGMYGLNAIPFHSPRPERADTDVSPADGQRDFDGVEYEGVPGELYIDSYIGALSGELVLLSLTGPEYLTNVDFIIYNDDEFQLSGQFSFACWTKVPLASISGYFTAQGLSTTPDTGSELDIDCNGVEDFDTGWAIVRPKSAISITSSAITDPPVLGALANDSAPFINARHLWESSTKQLNGAFPQTSPVASAPTTTIYGVDVFTDQLIAINPATGVGTAVGPVGFSRVFGVAFDPSTSTLYGTDEFTDQLITIDIATGAGTAVGPTGFGNISSLTLDTATGTLYGVDPFARRLLTINKATGAATPIGGLLNFVDVWGLTIDPTTNQLFGSDVSTQTLLAIDPFAIPVASAIIAMPPFGGIGSLGFMFVTGIDVDPVTNVFYGMDEFGDQLLLVDRVHGTAQAVGFTGFAGITDIAAVTF